MVDDMVNQIVVGGGQRRASAGLSFGARGEKLGQAASGWLSVQLSLSNSCPRLSHLSRPQLPLSLTLSGDRIRHHVFDGVSRRVLI